MRKKKKKKVGLGWAGLVEGQGRALVLLIVLYTPHTFFLFSIHEYRTIDLKVYP